MHIDDERLQRVLHGELSPSAQSTVRAHLDQCEECRERVGRAAREEKSIVALLQTIDRPVPALRQGSMSQPRRDRRRSTWRTRAAAVITGLAIAGAAYAAPGSPMRALVRGLFTQRTDHPDVPPIGQGRSGLPTTGLAVLPGDRLTIDLVTAPSNGVATAALVDGDEVVVRAIGGQPKFRAEINRLVIENSMTVSELAIDIPRRAPFVEIRLGGRPVLRKAGSEMTGGRTDSNGRYVLTINP